MKTPQRPIIEVDLIGCDGALRSALEDELASGGFEIHRVAEQLAAYEPAVDRQRAAKQLVILHIKQSADLEAVERLRGVMVGVPMLGFIDDRQGGDLLPRAMRAGVAQVLHTPFDARDFREAINTLLKEYGLRASQGVVLAVSGIHGGCGASTLSINLACEIARLTDRVCLAIELPLQGGSFGIYLESRPEWTIEDLFARHSAGDRESLERAAAPLIPGVDVLAASFDELDAVAPSPDELRRFLRSARTCRDLVILDLPASYQDSYFAALEEADYVLLIGEQNVLAVHRLAMLVERLSDERAADTVAVVMSRYTSSIGELTTDMLSQRFGGVEVLSVANDYEAVSHAMNLGRPVREVAPHSAAVRDFESLARWIGQRVLKLPPAAMGQRRGLLAQVRELLKSR